MKGMAGLVLWSGLALGALVGCGGEATEGSASSPKGEAPEGARAESEAGDEAGGGAAPAQGRGEVVADPVAATAPPLDYEDEAAQREHVGTVDLAPSPEASARPLRRMTVKQLRRAISQATQGVVWRDERGNDVLEMLAPTLGVPNYIDTTTEDLEASLVFQKFLGDGVRVVCDEAIRQDLARDPGDRVLLRGVNTDLSWDAASPSERAEMDRNLRDLQLRFTGLYVAPNDEEGVSRLRWLLRSTTHATHEPHKGWRAVCVGLMSSPEFYLY